MDILKMNSLALCWSVVGLGGTVSTSTPSKTGPIQTTCRWLFGVSASQKQALPIPPSKTASTAITAHPSSGRWATSSLIRASVAPRRHRSWSTGQRESGPSSRAVLSPIFTTSAVGGGEFTRRVPTAANSALDEATGRVSRGWALPTAEQTIGNMTLTDTLGFVSTNKAIYAIPTPRRHPHPIWSVAAEGDMALTSDGTLIVTGQAPDYGDPRALAAYRLRQRG
jgi:hypothetical protein